MVPPDKLFPSFIIFHTKKRILLPITTHNYTPHLSGPKLCFALPGHCHLCSSRLFSVSNTLCPHHLCPWVCPPKFPVVGYVPCVDFWYNPCRSCFLFFCCTIQFTHAHFVICYLIFFLSSDLHFCISKNKSLSLSLISFIFFFFSTPVLQLGRIILISIPVL